MPKFVFRKLVRDKLPEVYEELHQKTVIRRIDGDELWRELKRKFIEEASELPENMDDKEVLTSELGDLLRVLKDSAAHAGVDFAEIEKSDMLKTAKKGGFLKGVYVETLETEGNDPWNDYYRKEPQRFPELKETLDIEEIIELSDHLAELGNIDRRTLLPGGRNESDSHHSFSLALTAYDICQKYCTELDRNLVVRYALVHDLLEIILGDEDTLRSTTAELHAKHQREQAAWQHLEERLRHYPSLLLALKEYEALDTPEAATVYVLDKTCTIWTHFWDGGKSLHSRGAASRNDIDIWYKTQQNKLQKRLKVMPPQIILDIFTDSYGKMRKELFHS